MRIGQVVANLGIEEPPGQDVILAQPRGNGFEHWPLSECSSRELDGEPNLYIASGMFAKGSVGRYAGRIEANLRSVYTLPFDCDLGDFLNLADKGFLHRLSQDELDEFVAELVETVTAAFRFAGVELSRIDYTGYGICAYVDVDPLDWHEVTRLRRAHKALVRRINAIAGRKLCDTQVSDAGTRITRLPGCVNPKGETPRVSRTMHQSGAISTLGALEAAGSQISTPVRQMIPDHGQALAESDELGIAELLRASWIEGRRHALALGIAGMLAKAGVPEEQAQRLIDRLAAGDAEAWDRRKAVTSTYERVRSGLEVQGFYTLRDSLPAGALEEIDERLSRFRDAARARVLISPIRQGERGRGTASSFVATASADLELPRSVLGGLHGEYVRMLSGTTEAADSLLLAGFVGVCAATMGRWVSVEYARDLFPNLFICLVGTTGFSRKDHAIDMAIDVKTYGVELRAQRRGTRSIEAQPFSLSTDISSAEGLVKQLGESSNLLIRLRELSLLLDNAQRKGTRTIPDKLIELWDSPPIVSNNSKMNGVVVENPCLNVLAPTQPDRLERKMSEEDVLSGFANRWLYFFGDDKEPMAEPPRPDWAALGELFETFMGRLDDRKGETFRLTPEAKALWIPWYTDTLTEARQDPVGGPMRVRHHPIARKLALQFAVADGAMCIDVPHLERAIALCDWSWRHLTKSVYGWGAHDEVRMERRIVEVLGERGPMKKWRLQAACKRANWPQTMFHRVIDAMVRSGTLMRTGDDTVLLREQAAAGEVDERLQDQAEDAS